jgi:PhnB protein
MADEPQFAPIQVYLTVRGGDAASKFYQKAFGAKETQRQLAEDKQRLMHCDLAAFGGSIMLSDEFPEMGQADTLSPATRGGASVTIHINLPKATDIDRVMKTAATAGAKITMPAADMFWGARYGRMLDPFGQSWSFGAPAAKAVEERAPQRALAKRASARPKPKAKTTTSAKGKATARPSRSGRR